MSTISKTTAIVLYQDHLCDGIFSLTLGCGQIARSCVPGQFVSVMCGDKSRLLPRPISICDRNVEEGTIRLVYRVAGAGTEEFSHLVSADTVEIMGPLGNGYPMENLLHCGRQSGQIWLMGGGIGIPPMLLLAKELAADPDIAVHAILGYRDALFLNGEFEKIPGVAVHIATEDGSSGAKGTVFNGLPEGRSGAICACGPTPMLRAVRSYALERDIPCYLSLEQRMACGIGACLACVCESAGVDEHSRVNNKRVCAEGPVFEAGQIVL